MSIEIHNIGRTVITKESLANFATDLTGTATYYELPIIEGSAQLTLNTGILEVPIQQQHIDGYPLTVLGPKEAMLSFQVPLYASGIAAGDGSVSVAETDNALMQLLAIVFGGIDGANTGSDVSTAASASLVTPTDDTDFIQGCAIGWANSAGSIEARVVATQSGSSINTKSAWSATPSTSDVLYAGTTIYPTQDCTDSAQFIVEGAEQSDRWLLMGGQSTAAITLDRVNGEVPKLTFTLTFADWAREPEAAITFASYDNYEPTYVHGDFAIKEAGPAVTTHPQLDAASVQYAFNGPVYQPVRSPNGTNTIARWRRSRTPPFVAVTVSLPFEDATWFTGRDNRKRYYIHDQIGLTAGGIWLLETSAAQVHNPQRTDQDGLAYQSVEFRAGLDNGIGSASGDLELAAFRMHQL